MSLYKQFQTDPGVERGGVLVDYGSFRVRVGRAGGANRNYQRVLSAKTKPYQRALATGLMPPEQAERILLETFAEAVVMDWETQVDGEWVRGIEGPEGDVLPFSKENVMKTLTALPDLFADLRAQASDYSLFRAQIREDQAGN